MDISQLSKQREFVYKIGSKYIIIGGRAWDECTDPVLIAQLDEYNKLFREEYDSCHQDVDPRDFINKSRISELFHMIDVACRCFEGHEHLGTSILQSRFDRLSKEQQSELESQFADRLKASVMYDYSRKY